MKQTIKKLGYFSLFACISAFAQFSNVRISNPSSIKPEEVTIAVNPYNPSNIAAGANINFIYYSNDAGKTWSEKTLNSSFGVWGDPSVIFDAEGSLYFGHLSNPPNEIGYWIDRIVVQKSEDGGQTWDDGAGIGFSPPQKNQDKEWLAADISNSFFRNNLYMAWTEFDRYNSADPADHSRILFSRSEDHGNSWSTPIKVSEVEGNCLDGDYTTEGAVPAVGPNGEVYLCWSGPEGIVFDRSFDGGKSFRGNIFVTDQSGGWDFSVEGIYRCNGMPVTGCDISNSIYRGNIYIMWSDQRYGEDNTDVFLSHSSDSGDTWSPPVRVNNDNSGRHQFFPWMAVDPVTGIIYISFYDRRQTEGVDTDVYLARSDNGGENFTNIQISESSFTPESNTFFGDYTNISAYNGKIYPIWMRMDYDDFFKLSVWTAPLTDSTIVKSIEEDVLQPERYNLGQNYPNPFNSTTKIPFSLQATEKVTINIFNSSGKKVTTIADGVFGPGGHSVEFDGSAFASGLYFFTLNAGHLPVRARKMILIK